MIDIKNRATWLRRTRIAKILLKKAETLEKKNDVLLIPAIQKLREDADILIKQSKTEGDFIDPR